MKIFVSVPFVFFNDTGERLFLKNEQREKEEEEEEQLLDEGGEPLLINRRKNIARVGGKDLQGRVQWSPSFPLEVGVFNRRLSGKAKEIVIEIQQGKGLLHRTHFVYLTGRFLICNQSSFDLQISEDEGSSPPVSLPRHCSSPFHCSQLGVDRLVHLQLTSSNLLSGCFSICQQRSFDLSLPSTGTHFSLVHLQVLEDRGHFLLLITDSSGSLRLCNRSDLPVEFHQSCLSHSRTVLGGETIAYALDEPREKGILTLHVPGGTRVKFDLLRSEEECLFYPNWIYLSFEENLVVDYLEKRLIVAERNEERPSQWWVSTEEGVLIHWDSSSSSLQWTGKTFTEEELSETFVLDVLSLLSLVHSIN